jgi:hypothetical protein
MTMGASKRESTRCNAFSETENIFPLTIPRLNVRLLEDSQSQKVKRPEVGLNI